MIYRKIRSFINAYNADKEFKRKCSFVFPKLEDEESKRIFKARIDFYCTTLERLRKYIPCISPSFLRFHCRMMEITSSIYRIEELEQYRGKRLVVFGNGISYDYTLSVLKNSEWKNLYRGIGNNLDCLNSIKQDEILLPVLGDEYEEFISLLKNNYKSIIVHKVVQSLQYLPKLRQSCILGTINNQYFDVFSSNPNEVVIDCGAFDGQTEIDILGWGGSNISKIYAFELDPENAKKCIEFYASNNIADKVVLINKGTYSESKAISINSKYLGQSYSQISDPCDANVKAYVAKIDDEINDRVTFIKMDIEGAELDSLKGAKETIIKHKPKLAICIYHKQSDLFEIPGYILSIVPEYRFYIRHYTSYLWETVLYAYIP